MSDLHDNTVAWESIVKYLEVEKIAELINCGDTCAPAMLQEMSKTYSGQIDTVFGNVADRELETTVVQGLSNVTHYGDQGTITIDDKKIFFNHFPNVAEQIAKMGEVDLVCHGHTHLKRWEPSTTPHAARRVLGDAHHEHTTMILNPGTAGGMFQYPSIATIDLQTMNCKFIDITV